MIDRTKKDLILNCVRVGMSRYKSYLIAECTDDDIAEIEKDEMFQGRLTYEEAALEKDLYDKLQLIIARNEKKGNSTEIRYLLDKMGSGKENKNAERDNVQFYLPDNGRTPQ